MGSKTSKTKRVARYENADVMPSLNAVNEFEQVHDDRVTSVAVFKSGVCVSGSTDMSIGIFNYEKGKLYTRWKAHDKDITKVCCGSIHDQSMVFSSSRDKTIKSWLINENNDVQLQCIYDGHELVVTAIDTNPDCSVLCSGSRDNSMKLWDIERAHCLRSNAVTRNLITCVKWFSNENNLIAQAGEDKMLRIWDSRSLEVAFIFPPKQYFATCCDVSSDGRFVLTSSNGFNGSGCELILWDVRGKKQIYTYLGHEQTVSSCCFLPRRNEITSWPLIMSASHDSTVKIWNQETQSTPNRITFALDEKWIIPDKDKRGVSKCTGRGCVALTVHIKCDQMHIYLECLTTERFFGSGHLTDLAVWENGKFCVSSFNGRIYQLDVNSDSEGGFTIKTQTHF